MSRILEIKALSEKYIAELGDNIIRVVEASNTVDWNKKQMLSNTTADDRPLIHRLTGSEYLSKAYQKRTGKKKPNLKLTGAFQEEMMLTMPDEKQYFVVSFDEKSQILQNNYGNIFGISPKNRPEVIQMNNNAVIEDYLKTVFG